MFTLNDTILYSIVIQRVYAASQINSPLVEQARQMFREDMVKKLSKKPWIVDHSEQNFITSRIHDSLAGQLCLISLSPAKGLHQALAFSKLYAKIM